MLWNHSSGCVAVSGPIRGDCWCVGVFWAHDTGCWDLLRCVTFVASLNLQRGTEQEEGRGNHGTSMLPGACLVGRCLLKFYWTTGGTRFTHDGAAAGLCWTGGSCLVTINPEFFSVGLTLLSLVKLSKCVGDLRVSCGNGEQLFQIKAWS